MSSPAKKTILLVEDQGSVAAVEKKSLEGCGYEVILARSGERAIEIMEGENVVDLILMDIDLGAGIDGTEAARVILKDHDIPLLFVSGHTDPEVVGKTEKISFYGYVVKKSGITVLDASIKMAFKLFEANRTTKTTRDMLEATLDALPDTLFEVGLDGRIFSHHSPHPELLHQGSGEIVGKRIQDIHPPGIAETMMAAVLEAHEEGFPTGRQFEMAVPAGLCYFEISVSRKASPSTEPRFIILKRDITGRRQAEETQKALHELRVHQIELETQNEELRRIQAEIEGLRSRYFRLYDLAPVGYCTVSEEGLILEANLATTALLGSDRATLTAKPISRFINMEDEAIFYQHRRRLLLTSVPQSWEMRMVRLDGMAFWAQLEATVAEDGDGTTKFHVVITDISTRKRAEEELQETRAILQAALDQSQVGIAIADAPDGLLRYVNDAGLLIKGGSRESVVNGVGIDQYVASWQILDLDGSSLPADAVPLTRAIRYGETGSREFIIRRAENDDRVVLANAAPIKDARGKVAAGIVVFMDITERRRMEEALRESEGKFRNLVWDMQVGVLLQGPSSEIMLSNPKALELLGLTEEQLLGKTSFDPDWNVIHEDGSPFPGPTHPVPQAIATRRAVLDVVMGVYHPVIGDRVWLSVDAEPRLNGDGTVREVVCSFVDITERKRAEKALEDAFQENRNLLGELQHRVKNSFNLISSMIGLTSSAILSSEAKNAFLELDSRVRAVAELYSLLYSAGSFTELRLDDYCIRVATPLVELLGNISLCTEMENITITAKKAAPIGLIVTELVTNAIKYAFPSGRSGTITMKLGKSAMGITLEIMDDGIGLPAGFDSHQTSGMGLNLVRGLAHQIKGNFRVEAPSSGAHFVVEFDGEP